MQRYHIEYHYGYAKLKYILCRMLVAGMLGVEYESPAYTIGERSLSTTEVKMATSMAEVICGTYEKENNRKEYHSR